MAMVLQSLKLGLLQLRTKSLKLPLTAEARWGRPAEAAAATRKVVGNFMVAIVVVVLA